MRTRTRTIWILKTFWKFLGFRRTTAVKSHLNSCLKCSTRKGKDLLEWSNSQLYANQSGKDSHRLKYSRWLTTRIRTGTEESVTRSLLILSQRNIRKWDEWTKSLFLYFICILYHLKSIFFYLYINYHIDSIIRL